jgi:hypothetical protein
MEREGREQKKIKKNREENMKRENSAKQEN